MNLPQEWYFEIAKTTTILILQFYKKFETFEFPIFFHSYKITDDSLLIFRIQNHRNEKVYIVSDKFRQCFHNHTNR